jgi:cysteine desulfurase family protein (TIGR01976 family)
MTLDLTAIRSQFPALDRPAIFFDNPGGTQCPQMVIDAMSSYLANDNANHGGAFATSVRSDAMLHDAHQAMADMLNASSKNEIVFGPNMTTLTLSLSRALARTFNPGDEIVVTRLDHDANISPWLLAAEDRGCNITWVDFDVEDCTLKLDDFERALAKKPKLVAFGYASNAVGTINPVHRLTRMAHEAGALVYVDAVQYAPHGPIDVQDIGCDFLVCSAYKFFGPHVGILYGRYDLLDGLRAYKVRPAPALPPGKFETGTQNHEGIAGVLGAVEYLAWVGETFGGEGESWREAGFSGRKLAVHKGLAAIRSYEMDLSRALIEAIESVPGTRIYGLTDPKKMDQRVPTVSFRLEGKPPRAIAEALGNEGFYVWDGNYYALAVTDRLGIETSGGMVRVGAAHYNTVDEVARFGEALKKIAA